MKGYVKGLGRGLGGAVYYPLKGLALTAEDIGAHAANAGVVVKTLSQEHYLGAKKRVGYVQHSADQANAVNCAGQQTVHVVQFVQHHVFICQDI